MIRRPPRSTLFPYHDALPICLLLDELRQGRPGLLRQRGDVRGGAVTGLRGEPRDPARAVLDEEEGEHQRQDQVDQDRKSTRLNSSHANISYAVFCLKKKNTY